MIVYERNDEIGGLLRYGIPTMKLGKDVRLLSLYLCLTSLFTTWNRHYAAVVRSTLLSDARVRVCVCSGGSAARGPNGV